MIYDLKIKKLSLSQRHKPLATKYTYIINLKSTGTMYIVSCSVCTLLYY